jgi:hypothetical protein
MLCGCKYAQPVKLMLIISIELAINGVLSSVEKRSAAKRAWLSKLPGFQ